MSYETKDSGERERYASGMVRDVDTGKTDYTYCLQGPMLERWAQLMQRGAIVKGYGRDNWMKASGVDELERFKQSALRHMIQWLRGDEDEDHAAAILFNVNGAEYVRDLDAGYDDQGAPAMKWQHYHDEINGWIDVGSGVCSLGPASAPEYAYAKPEVWRQVPV